MSGSATTPNQTISQLFCLLKGEAKHVISTEATDGFIVRCAVERRCISPFFKKEQAR